MIEHFIFGAIVMALIIAAAYGLDALFDVMDERLK